MRNICLQSTLRQRLRTLFLLILVGLISFAFISRAVEYLVVDRETDRLAGYYRAIGYLEGEGQWDDLSEGAELVAKSQYVASEDRRRSCSGVLQGLYNANIGGSYQPNTHQVVVAYGELISKIQISIGYMLTFQVDQVLVGYPEHVQEGGSIRVRWLSEDFGDMDPAAYASLQVGKRYLVSTYYSYTFSRFKLENAPDNLVLRPLNDSGLWLLPVEPGTSADFSDPALAELEKELLAQKENQRAMSVVGTKDMSAMPAVQQSFQIYYLTEGRWLNRMDDINGDRVCVVNQTFADWRGLSMGDAITLELRNLKAPNYLIYPDGEDFGLWQDYVTYTEEFEIVGMYSHFGGSDWGATGRIYIPDSCMPAGYEKWLWGGSWFYSFILRSPWDTEAFLAENQGALAALGMQATFVDTGWENFQASVRPMKRSAALSAGVFALVLVMALALAAFLYLRQRRRDFAILRSLGVPKQTAIRQMLQPMALVGMVGILLGGLAAWFYALGKASNTLASLPESAIPSAVLSPVWLAGLCAATFALLLLFTSVGTIMTARSPVLELLQGVAGQAGGIRKPKEDTLSGYQQAEAKTVQSAPARAISLGEASAPTRNLGFAQVPRYILRHTRRAPMKSILTVAVALSFTLSLGWMSWTMERNEVELDRLYQTTQVEAIIIGTNSAHVSSGFIRRQTVDTILRSGFVESAYLEGTGSAPLVTAMGEGGIEYSERPVRGTPLRAFDQPEQFFSSSGSDITVEYAQGWDESLFVQDWTEEQVRPVLLPADMMERLRLQTGGIITISNSVTSKESYIVAGQYTGPVKGCAEAYPILLPMSALKQIGWNELLYITAEFVLDPAMNRELPEFKNKMEALFKTNVGTVPLTFLFWDEELTQVVEPLEKNLQLMEILFPVTVAVSVLIAAGLAVLLMFQAAREASIMRVLGTTKGRARAILCGEQLFLCFLGLLLGLALLIALRQEAAAVLTGPALICALLYFAGVICGSIPSAVSVTNRMPLELLQVKE